MVKLSILNSPFTIMVIYFAGKISIRQAICLDYTKSKLKLIKLEIRSVSAMFLRFWSDIHPANCSILTAVSYAKYRFSYRISFMIH